MISIIVPVYNSEKRLPLLIDSINNQTYKDFEVLLIDDGSKDNSGKLCDEYAKKYKNFRTFHKSNGGQSSARNIGIQEAKGEYIYFADNDDELISDCLETLITGIISQDNIDWAIGKPLCRVGNSIVNDDNKPIEVHIFSQEEVLLEFLRPKFYACQGPWAHLFKTSIIKDNGIRFNEKIVGTEDRVFIIDYLCCIKGKVYHTTQPIYIWNVGIGTLNTLTSTYNKKYVRIFYGQCEVYKKVKAYNFPRKCLWWAKHIMINSYFDKEKYYKRFQDQQTINEMNKILSELVTQRELFYFKIRENMKNALKPILPILRYIRK